MSREIKFRGYATGIGWVYGSLVNNLWTYSELSGNEKGSPVFEIITGKYDGSCWTDVAEEEGEAIVSVVPQSVGQFTGLLDKNGKEIYDGDVIKIHTGALTILPNSPTFHKGIIVWNENVCAFQYAYKAIGGEMTNTLYNHEITKYEVIGNIFENPELLNP